MFFGLISVQSLVCSPQTVTPTPYYTQVYIPPRLSYTTSVILCSVTHRTTFGQHLLEEDLAKILLTAATIDSRHATEAVASVKKSEFYMPGFLLKATSSSDNLYRAWCYNSIATMIQSLAVQLSQEEVATSTTTCLVPLPKGKSGEKICFLHFLVEKFECFRSNIFGDTTSS